MDNRILFKFPSVDSIGFKAPMLQDVLRDAALFGSLPDVQVPMSYDDDDVSSVDDLSDIRVGRLERAEAKLSAAQRQRYSSVLAARAAFEAKNDSLSTAKASETAGEH